MLKKAFSILLCIMACITCFSVTSINTKAAYDARNLFAVTSKTVKDDLIKYTINIPAQQNGIAGAIVLVEYDSAVLKPVSCGPAKTINSKGKAVQNFEGTFLHGVSKDNKNVYSIAYMNSIAVSTGTKAKPFFEVTFKVINSKKPNTNVKFSCKEYMSVADPEKNITSADGVQAFKTYKNVITLESPELGKITPITNGFSITWSPVTGAKGYVVYRSTSDGGRVAIGKTTGVNSTSYKDTEGLKSGVKYTYTITATNDYCESSIGTSSVSAKYVAKPTVTAVKNAVGGVSITWKKASGAKEYNVMRRASGETKWKKIAVVSASKDAYYKDTSVSDSVQYEYDVNSVADSFISPTVSAGKKVVYIKAPQVKTVTNEASGVKVSWSSHSKATKYIIYKKTVGKDSSLQKYKETTKTSFVDTQVTSGKTYTYSVKTVTAKGSSAYNTTGHSITRVPSTTVTGLRLNKLSVRVTWKSVKGVDGYVVYRRKASATSWTKVTTVKNSVTYYDDRGVSSGVKYVYAVTPIMNNSEGAKVASKSFYFIKSPTSVTATSARNGVTLNWVKCAGATSYRIYRSTGSGAKSHIATVKDGSKVTYTDTKAKNETKYTYTIIAVSKAGSSKESTPVSIYRWNQEIRTKVALAKGGIKVTWEKNSRATGYMVYRSVNGGKWTEVAKVTKNQYLDKNVSSNKSYSYAVGMIVKGSVGVLYKPQKPQIVYIAPVSKITAVNSSTYTTVSWKAVAGATKYYIYKADSQGGELKHIGTTNKDTLKFVDKKVSGGKVAYYSVRCNNGKLTSTHTITPKRNVFLEIPQIKSVENTYTGQKISWNKVKGANGYKLYYKIYGEKEYKYIKTVDAKTLSYTNKNVTNGKIMCYCIKAANSESLSSYTAKCYTYATPPKVTLSNSKSGVLLEWKVNKSAAGYWVYRKAEGAKNWTRIACVTKNYYTDTTAKSGNRYFYTVKTYTGKVLSGCNNDGWRIYHLSAPVLTSVSNGYGGIVCSWKAVPGAKNYVVYRKASNDKEWTRIGTTSSTSYKDSNVKNLGTYSYVVKAVRGSTSSAYTATAKSVKYIVAPVASISNSTSGIYLQWGKVSGASSYYIYRKEGNAKNWTKIDTVTQTAYLDTNVKPGVAYTYTVKAYVSKTLSGCNENGWKSVFLNTPNMESVTSNPGGVQVKWGKVPYATSYAVFRKAPGDKAWTLIGTTPDNGSVTYIDKTAKAGITYTYTVRACYGNYRSWFQAGLSCKV